MGNRNTLLCELTIMYKSIISQDRFWIIPSDVEWDGQGYPQTSNVRCCMLDNAEEMASFEAFMSTQGIQ